MQRRDWVWVAVIGGAWALAVGLIQWLKYQAFAYNGLDLGIYSQVVWSLANGQGFASSIHDPTYLGDHVELWLAPLAIIYKLWSHPLTLLWAQTLVLASAVWPLARLVARRFGRRPALIAAILWCLHPLLYNAALYEFHGLVLALPLLMWSIVWYEERRYRWWLVTLIGLLFVREDVPLLVAGWALYSALDRRNWVWWLVPGALGLASFFGFQWLIQAASPAESYKYLAFYAWLGHTPADMATFPFRHPLIFIGHVFSIQNWQTVISFLMPFGFLPLFGLRRLWPVALIAIQLLLLGARTDSIIRLHYVIPYLPFLVWATLDGLVGLRHRFASTLPDRGLQRLAAIIILSAGVAYGQLVFGAAEWPWKKNVYASPTPPELLTGALRAVRPTDRALTTFHLLPALSQRPAAYSLNYLHLGRRQYSEDPYQLPTGIDVAVIDWQQYYEFQFLYRDTLYRDQTGIQRLERTLADQGLRLSSWVDSVAIYSRHGQDDFQPVEVFNEQPAGPGAPVFAALGTPTAAVTDNPNLPAGWREVTVGARWRNGPKFELPPSIRFDLIQNDVTVWSSTRILGQGFHPAEAWPAGSVRHTWYRLAVPPEVTGEFFLTATVMELDGRMRLNRWRSFAPVVGSAKKITEVDFGLLRL